MNRTKISLVTLAAVGMTVLVSSGTALAGWQTTQTVTVTPFASGGGIAEGTLSAAAHSADTVQHIGCQVYVSTTSTYGWCTATDVNGVGLSCTTIDRSLLAEMGKITDHTNLRFRANTDGSCGYVYLKKHSNDIE